MKICPFISHMLGDDNTNAMTIDEPDRGKSKSKTKSKRQAKSGSNVVVLGYDEESRGRSKGSGTAGEVASHLYCLKEPCRFYHKKTGDCQFDLVFNALEEAGKKEAPKTPDLSKDIDKIWKFQTKSVAELIDSIGDVEKKQTKSLEQLKKDVDKSLAAMTTELGKADGKSAPDLKTPLADVKKTVENLHKKLDDRDEGIDNLSTTFSELVVNVHESISQLQGRTDTMNKQIDKMQSSLPSESAMKKMVEDTIARKLKDIDMPDMSKPLARLEKMIEEVAGRDDAPSSDLVDKLEATLEAQRDIKQMMAKWSEKIAEDVRALESSQSQWEQRINKLVESQNELAGHLEENKKHIDNETVKTGKKEAKKFNNLGVTSFHNGAYEMAKDQFLQAVKIDPEFAEAFNNLGLAYTELDEDDDATEAFSRAVELNPSLHAAYNNLGYIYFKKGDYTQAIEMYNEALGRSTNNSSAYTNLGNAYYKMGKTTDARDAWTKALEIDPGNDKARRNLKRISEGVT